MGAPWKLRGYVVERLLGRGGSGEVWRARIATTGEPVALKRIVAADPEQAARAASEAALLAALDHPHLVRLHAFVPQPDAAVLVLDLADGGSLAQLLAARGRLAAGEVITAVAPVAAALAYAHAEGVVHGDVTPANILFTGGGVALLADLGVARLTGDDTDAESTPAYVDPAVAAGCVPGPQTDVFMLGAVTLHALTGAPPWPQPSAEQALARARVGALPDVAGALAAAGVGAEMAAVIVRALAIEPHRRGTAADFALDLRHSGHPVAVELGAGRERGDPAAPPPGPDEARSAAGPEPVGRHVPRHAAPPPPPAQALRPWRRGRSTVGSAPPRRDRAGLPAPAGTTRAGTAPAGTTPRDAGSSWAAELGHRAVESDAGASARPPSGAGGAAQVPAVSALGPAVPQAVVRAAEPGARLAGAARPFVGGLAAGRPDFDRPALGGPRPVTGPPPLRGPVAGQSVAGEAVAGQAVGGSEVNAATLHRPDRLPRVGAAAPTRAAGPRPRPAIPRPVRRRESRRRVAVLAAAIAVVLVGAGGWFWSHRSGAEHTAVRHPLPTRPTGPRSAAPAHSSLSQPASPRPSAPRSAVPTHESAAAAPSPGRVSAPAPTLARRSGSAPQQPGARPTSVAAWVRSLQALDAVRARAFANRDTALLAQVYPSGPLLDADRAQLSRLVPAGCGLPGARTSYTRVQVTPRGDEAAVVATARLPTTDLVCHGRVRGHATAVGPVHLQLTLGWSPGRGPRILDQQVT